MSRSVFVIALFLSSISTISQAEETGDWKLNFLRAKQNVLEMLTRIEPRYFSAEPGAETNARVATALASHKAALVAFVRTSTFVYTQGDNPNFECSDIQSPQIHLSARACRELTLRNAEQDLLRELFLKIAEADDELSRWAAFTISQGWAQNSQQIPIFPIEGVYSLTKEGGGNVTATITATITATNTGYAISTTGLTNWNNVSLTYSELEGAGTAWAAQVSNPSTFTRSYSGSDIGRIYRTATGSESLSLTFAAPNRLTLTLRDLVTNFRFYTEVYTTTPGNWVWVDTTKDVTYNGRKN